MSMRKYARRVGWIKMIRVVSDIKDERDRMAVAAQAQVALFQEKIRQLLSDQGVYSDLHHQYMAYAEALDKSQKELTHMVDLIREHQILRDRFERRALDPAILDVIDQLVIYRTKNY